MKRVLITLSYIFIVLSSAYGQKSQVEFQIIANPNYSSRYLDASKDFKEALNERGIFGYDFGVQVVPIKKNRLSFITGILFSRKGYSWGKFILRNSQNLPVGEAEPKEIFSFIEIPLKVSYRLGKESKSYVMLGLCNDILVNHDIKLDYDVNEDYYFPEKGIRWYNLGINAGFGYDIASISKITISLEPNIKFQLFQTLKDEHPAKRYLCTIGLTINTKLKL